MLTLQKNEHHSAIMSEPGPAVGKTVVRKTVPSAFFGTPLVQWLTQQGVQMLEATGACLRASVVAAMSWVCAQLSSAVLWVRIKGAARREHHQHRTKIGSDNV
jgi:nicotinamidase-related amidase